MKQAATLFFLLFPLLLAAETVLGGSASAGFDVMLTSVTGEAPHAGGNLELAFQLDVDSAYFTLSLEPGILYDRAAQTPALFLNRAELQLAPAEFLSFAIGRFFYKPGTGELFSATNYFQGTDYTAVLSGKPEKAGIPNNLIQAKLFIKDFFFVFTAAPFHLQPVIPQPGSPWFPTKDLPKDITIPFPVEKVLTLGNLYVREAAPGNALLDKISLSVEGGFQTAFLDCSLVFYSGDDNSLLLGAEIDFPNGLFGAYDIYLTPQQNGMTALGLNLATNVAALRFWSDLSCSFNRTFMTNKLSSTSFDTIPVQSPYLEYILGTSLEVEALNLLLLAEYKNSHILQPAERMIEPMPGTLLSFSAVLRLFNYTTQLRSLLLLSLADYSLATGISLSFTPVDEIELGCTYPFYMGAADTLFGQYAANNHFSFVLTVRY